MPPKKNSLKFKLTPAAKALYIIPFKELETHKAWRLTSKLVRLRAKGICYTCNSKPEKLFAGHFREKIGSSGIYFDLRGLRGQCFYCNRRLHGNYAIYHPKLIREIGIEEYEDLNKKAQRAKVWTLKELEEIIQEREVELNKYQT